MLWQLSSAARHFSLAFLALWSVSAAAANVSGDGSDAARPLPHPRGASVQFADGSAMPAAEGGSQLSAEQVPARAPHRASAPEAPGMLTAQETAPAQPAPPAAAASNGGAPISPAPDSKTLGPTEIEVTSFHSVTPGQSTKADVEKAWGKAKQTKSADGGVMQWYAVEPFPRVEVVYADDKVTSIIIRFDRAFPANQVAEQLDQLGLTKVQPVLVLNDMGEVLGQAYPERGVMFAFEPASDPAKAQKSVTHIVLEAITAEPFVLRAETNIDVRPEFSLHDVDQAIKLQPGNARSHWLRSRALTALGQHEQAAQAAAEAARLDPRDARFQVTKAQTLAQAGRISEAIPEAERAITLSEQRPHVKARAMCLLADLHAAGAKPDYKTALKMHTEALKAADALVVDRHPAIRIAAKEVLLDAHLGALEDIAWGPWKEKDRAAENWINKASEVAADLIKNEEGGDEYLFRVAVKALNADVGLQGKLEPSKWAREVIRSGEVQISAASEQGRKGELQWQVAKALYDAVQVCQMRGNQDEALHLGEMAVDYMQKSGRAEKSPSAGYLMGRTYFRIGAIYANGRNDHQTAVSWFEKAVPQLGKTPPPEAMNDLARLGDTFVSMGVSYWQAGHKKKAIALTEHGADLIEEAVRRGSSDRGVLVTPYTNLAVMKREMGDRADATRMQEMAQRAKGTLR